MRQDGRRRTVFLLRIEIYWTAARQRFFVFRATKSGGDSRDSNYREIETAIATIIYRYIRVLSLSGVFTPIRF